MARKIAAPSGALALVLLLLCACSGAPKATQLKVGYTNTSSFMGLFIAQKQGYFAKHGLEVTPVLIALNPTIPSALVGGSIQIGGATPSVMLQAVDAGIDIVAVAGAAVNDARNPAGGVVARTGLDIKTAKDFEGKRVGVPGIGAYQHVLFRRWLAEHGADYTKVNYVEVPLAQGSDILKAGNVDAMLLGEPYYRRVLASKSGYLVAPYLADMPDGLISMSYATKRDYALANGPVLKAFRAALEEATVFLAANPEESRKILAEGMRLPADVVDTMTLPRLEVKLQVGGLEYWEDTLLKQGMIRKAPDAASLIVTE